MKRPSITVSLLALCIPAALAESIIVFCNGKEAIDQARDLVLSTGGRIFYEYNELGGFAAVVTLAAVQNEQIFKTQCSFTLDQMIPAPRPVGVTPAERL